MHHGVAIVLTNQERTLFVLQEKDELYKPHPNGISLFGGEVEKGESPIVAIKRELKEELVEEVATFIIQEGIKEVCELTIQPEMGERYKLTLFECVQDNQTLLLLPKIRVREGKCAIACARENLLDLDFVWGLDLALKHYLQLHSWSVLEA